MNNPSTVAPKGESMIMPLAKIHATPAKGNMASTRESTRIIERKLPPLFDRSFLAALTPKLVASAPDEYIFQRRLAHRDRLNFTRKCLDYVRHKAVTAFLLDAHLIAQGRRLYVESSPNVLSQSTGIPRRIEHHDVSADLAFQFFRRTQRDEVAFVHDGQPVAALGFFHQMRCYQHRHMLFIAQNLQVLPQIAPSSRVKPSGRFIEQQNPRMMQQAFSQLNAPLHAARECLNSFLRPVGQSDAR